MAKANIVGRQVVSEGGRRKISTLSFHALRHTSATSIYGNAALESIAKRVTQHNSASLKRYIHEDLEVLREATELMPRPPRTVQGANFSGEDR